MSSAIYVRIIKAERRSRCTYGRHSVTVEVFKQRDTLRRYKPGVGSPGRKGLKFSKEVYWNRGEKSFVYIQDARTANRHR